jgi:hypothetical protein
LSRPFTSFMRGRQSVDARHKVLGPAEGRTRVPGMTAWVLGTQ